jgi:hypothetical protein
MKIFNRLTDKYPDLLTENKLYTKAEVIGHVEAALKAAAEKARINRDNWMKEVAFYDVDGGTYTLDKDSILNAYNLNQIV